MKDFPKLSAFTLEKLADLWGLIESTSIQWGVYSYRISGWVWFPELEEVHALIRNENNPTERD